MARPRARWRAILALPSVSCFSPNAWVCARQVHSSVLGSPLSLWTPPHLRWLTHDAGARDARPVTFTRYWQPFQPPQINAGAFLPSSTLAFTEALERHDIPTCLELLRADHLTLPYPLWLSLWTLVAEGPSPIPSHGLYERLDIVCNHLYELYVYHQDTYPNRTIPPLMRQRFVYLLLKRAERIDTTFSIDECPRQCYEQVATLVHVAGNAHTLDGDLAGRLVFRLARMHALDALLPILNAYVTRSDMPVDPISAGQPLAAVLDESLTWFSKTAPDNPTKQTALALGIEALRLAFLRNWPIKHTLVQRWLSCAGPSLTKTCLNAPTSPKLPPQITVSMQGANDIGGILRDVCAYRPQYMHERAVVVLSKLGDPRPAIDLLLSSSTCHSSLAPLPFDIYAAIISALTWMVRSNISRQAAMTLAVYVLDRLLQAGLRADEQMYGELIRALQCMLVPTSSRTSEVGSAWLKEYQAKLHHIEWHAYLVHFTTQMLARDDVGVIRIDHLRLLLRMHIQSRQFRMSRWLYEQIRDAYPDALPCSIPTMFSWLFLRAYSRPSSLSFAMRMYQDWLAFGHALPCAQIEPYLCALLSHGMASMAQRVIHDQCQLGRLPRSTLTVLVVRAYFVCGYFDAALAWASDLLALPDTTTPVTDSAHPAIPSLEYYAICLSEAGRCGQYGMDQHALLTLHRLFEEFQLGLAHAMTSDQVCLHTVTRAYYGMIQVLLKALEGETETSTLHDRTTHSNATDQSHAIYKRIEMLWHEWDDLFGTLSDGHSALALRDDMKTLLTQMEKFVPRPSAAQIDQERKGG